MPTLLLSVPSWHRVRVHKHLLRRRFAALLLQLELPGTLPAVLLLSAFIFQLGLGTVAGFCLWQLDIEGPLYRDIPI